MKEFKLKLKDCDKCPNVYYNDVSFFCCADGILKSLPDDLAFPEWCPLEDVECWKEIFEL